MEREMRERFDVRRPKRNIEEDIPSELPPSSRSDLQSNNDSDSFDVRLPPSRTARKPEVALPATAELAIPQFQYSLDQAQKSNFVGLNSGQDFRSHGPATEASATTADSNSDPNGTSNGTVFRVWFSRDRKFSIEAKFLEIKNGKAVLEKRDGTTIEVDPAGLCDEDGKYLQSR
jgi:hypothetical protein